MKTAREVTESMVEAGIISKDRVEDVERCFLRYIDGFRQQLIEDIKGENGDFDVMKEMSRKNQDIGIHLELLSFDRNKRGGKVTVGVAEPHFTALINQAAGGVQTHFAALYVVNIKQFNAIKNKKDA